MARASKYKGVSRYYMKRDNCDYWKMECRINNRRSTPMYFPYTEDGERKAAIAYDKFRLNNGLTPVNILKKLNE